MYCVFVYLEDLRIVFDGDLPGMMTKSIMRHFSRLAEHFGDGS